MSTWPRWRLVVFDLEVDGHRADEQRVAQRNHVRGALGRLNASYAGDGEHITLLDLTVGDGRGGLRLHEHLATSDRATVCRILGRDVDHASAAEGVKVCKGLFGHRRSLPGTVVCKGVTVPCLWYGLTLPTKVTRTEIGRGRNTTMKIISRLLAVTAVAATGAALGAAYRGAGDLGFRSPCKHARYSRSYVHRSRQRPVLPCRWRTACRHHRRQPWLRLRCQRNDQDPRRQRDNHVDLPRRTTVFRGRGVPGDLRHGAMRLGSLHQSRRRRG